MVLAALFQVLKTENPSILDLQEILGPIVANHSRAPVLRQSETLYHNKDEFYMDMSEYSRQYPALQEYHCRTFIGLSGYCRTSDPLIILAVKSHPASSGRRSALRYTWAQERRIWGYRFLPVFLLANSGRRPEIESLVEEALFYGDIVLWDFMESHHNLSLKERCFLEWLHYRCPEAKYILKADDDEFVNPHSLASYISSTVQRFPLQVHGFCQTRAPVERNGKYGIPVSAFPNKFYPPFVSGGGFLFPGEVVPSLLQASLTIPVFPLDDVYFGLLALAANVSFHHELRFRTFGLKSNEICRFRDVLVVHRLSRRRLLEIWDALPYTLPCPPSDTEKQEYERIVQSVQRSDDRSAKVDLSSDKLFI
ncbi:PREDICTED: beta-1,3-galactosyltransferase 5-like [Nanorana parkeri]|uniref:beta-1,3-galactosyltransferase 5-like n=1 Tax=Nanorana parkeri TaxID=125878 RepID=UPI00085407B9|nr:PREDICTED: beta-1,3-galactosyltransferase 5-like [Nanorana parkeri]